MSNLKIRDLSIGDCVKIDIYPTPYKIIDLSSRGYVWLLGRNRVAPIRVIEPIPITPEILKANGWTWDGMYAILRIDEHSHFEYYKHECRLTKLWKGIDEWQNHVEVSEITFRCHCRAVHQLQHALRLAGLNEDIRL